MDIFKLLHRETQSKEDSKAEERKLAKRLKVPLNVDTWTAAFMVYASIEVRKFWGRGRCYGHN